MSASMLDAIPADLRLKLEDPATAMAVLKGMAVLMNHYQNGLYTEARKMWQETQLLQIRKGAEKYPEPLNPDSWTSEQLVSHAMQENVDQAHYLTALAIKTRKLETQLSAVMKYGEQARALTDEMSMAMREIYAMAEAGETETMLEKIEKIHAMAGKFAISTPEAFGGVAV